MTNERAKEILAAKQPVKAGAPMGNHNAAGQHEIFGHKWEDIKQAQQTGSSALSKPIAKYDAASHKAKIEADVKKFKIPVHKDVVSQHGIELPHGYELEGDNHVFKASDPSLSSTVLAIASSHASRFTDRRANAGAEEAARAADAGDSYAARRARAEAWLKGVGEKVTAAGTSEGAKKGWEAKHGKSGSVYTHADLPGHHIEITSKGNWVHTGPEGYTKPAVNKGSHYSTMEAHMKSLVGTSEHN